MNLYLITQSDWVDDKHWILRARDAREAIENFKKTSDYDGSFGILCTSLDGYMHSAKYFCIAVNIGETFS